MSRGLVSRTSVLFFAAFSIVLLTGSTPPEPSIEVFFSPGGGCTDAIVREIKGAKASVLIQAYSFTSKPIAEAIIKAKKKGIHVEAILDSSNRTAKYSAGTFLHNQGVSVLIDAEHKIAHNKVILIDNSVVITGSFNFSKAAEYSNSENLLVIKGHPELAAKYVANWVTHREHSQPWESDEETTQETPKGKPKFVGSRRSDVFHYLSCKWAKDISMRNLVHYYEKPKGKRLHKGCPVR